MSIIHFIVDMQRCYANICPDYFRARGKLQQNICRLRNALNDQDILSVAVAYGTKEGFLPYPKGVGPRMHMPSRNQETLQRFPGADIDLLQSPDSLIAFKNHYSLYREPSIRDYVEREGYTTIILSGLTEGDIAKKDYYCVSETAFDFAKAGYNVIIAAEATNRGLPEMTRYYTSLEQRRDDHNAPGLRIMPIDEIMAGIDQRVRPQSASHRTPRSTRSAHPS